MPAEFSIDGDKVTLTFGYTQPLTVMKPIVEDAAHQLWDRGFGDHETYQTFDELSSQDWVDILDDYTKKSILALANERKTSEAKRLAVEAAAAAAAAEQYDF